ncbi:DNA polymerase IV [Niabella yanshanensis]|uniref:DNA polymerase IV n=1 Tax=Niabella yanshanensis TaxID=577386 RepID=A0ABZ0W8R4_9BACT|nr:DNA polymerase IV [Niabella yanshanensis]WQD38998.1 DNA polymerase IV [Niabella yanshanensis]
MDAAKFHRKIIHIDMDAFYASVEQRDFPDYKGKPLVVGGLPEGRGGVVATASYEARKFGIRSAMPSKTAQRLCPQAIFVFPRFDAYKAVSSHIREIFHRYTDIIEPLSLDEAYLDVTSDKQNIGSALDIAKLIKQAIKSELELTASAGISINKFVAKIASDMNKPDGLTFIGPSRVEQFMEGLAVEKFYGVGKVTATRMKAMGLHTGADLKKLSETEMIQYFGKPGKFYYQIVRGIDNREVQPQRETKSVSVEDTYQEDLTTRETMAPELSILTERLAKRLQRSGLKGKTVTVKFKFHDFTLITRSLSANSFINETEDIQQAVITILNNAPIEGKRIRLLGVGLSNFEKNKGSEDEIQLKLF